MQSLAPSFPRRSPRNGAAPCRSLSRLACAAAALTCLAGLTLTSACNQAGDNPNSKSSQSEKRMYLSSGEFNRGYQDGKRDAAASLMDASSVWMWGWMTETEYRKGYDQGWADGRKMKKLQSQQKSQQQEQGQQLQDRRKPGDQATMNPLAKPVKTVQVSVRDKERK